MTGVAVLVYQGTPIQVKDELFVVLSQGKFIGIPYITIIAFGHLHHRRADPQLYGLWKGCVCNWR